jgi:hypothetical protein
MISAVFESEKGKLLNQHRTICEVHRQLFDIIVWEFQDEPSTLKKLVGLLEEAFIMGVKMNAKLLEHKLSLSPDVFNSSYAKDKQARETRIRLVETLNQNQEFLAVYGDK